MDTTEKKHDITGPLCLSVFSMISQRKLSSSTDIYTKSFIANFILSHVKNSTSDGVH